MKYITDNKLEKELKTLQYQLPHNQDFNDMELRMPNYDLILSGYVRTNITYHDTYAEYDGRVLELEAYLVDDNCEQYELTPSQLELLKKYIS